MFKVEKNKYCCSLFSIYHKQPDTSDCIRVVRITSFSPNQLCIEYAVGDTGNIRFVKNSETPFRFFLMSPSHPSNPGEHYQKGIDGYMLSFCPFCGVISPKTSYDVKINNFNNFVA